MNKTEALFNTKADLTHSQLSSSAASDEVTVIANHVVQHNDNEAVQKVEIIVAPQKQELKSSAVLDSSDTLLLLVNPDQMDLHALNDKSDDYPSSLSEFAPVETFSRETLKVPLHQHLLSQGSSNSHALNLSLSSVHAEPLPVLCPFPETQMSAQLLLSLCKPTNEIRQLKDVTADKNSEYASIVCEDVVEIIHAIEPLDLSEKCETSNQIDSQNNGLFCTFLNLSQM